MQQPLRVTSVRHICALLVLLFFAVVTVNAQCPIANTCNPQPGTPPAANLAFGMGIFNVNVNNGAINNTTLGASEGYKDYSCTKGTSLVATVAYPISIQTNPNANENVKVWIDYNNDGSFNATTELAFTSLNNKLHTGTINIPATAVINTPLRMRVSADYIASPLPTPCSTPQYSQVEDYRITVTPNTSSPTTEFSASSTVTCSGIVSFTDLSQNGPTSWTWNFNDIGSGSANTSTLQNPTHTFSAPGTYTVTLTACNSVGCNTITKTAYINYHTNVPVAAICSPPTTNYCCGYGITNVNFGNGLMTNTSANGAAGYQDFTCSKSVSAIAGNSYSIALTSGTNPQDTRIYIDLNKDGNFTGSNEMVLEILNKVNPTGTITIPGTTFMNTPIRMRIISDEIGSVFNSCGGIQSGQAEDYTIIITPNPNPPVAQFTSNYGSSCDTIVQFTDQSANAPTSWLWNFGDLSSGSLNTSTLPNPTHIYHNIGNYTVTLTATNTNGSNTLTKTNYITIVKPCLNYCSSSGHNNTNLFISKVSLSNLNNTSGQGAAGYSDFTSQSAILVQGNPVTLSVTRSGAFTNSSVSTWIDYNRNGIFETTERVMAVNASNAIATTTFTTPATTPLGSTRMRVMTSSNMTAPTNPCLTNQFNMEVEDYTINIQTNQQPPIVDFTATSQVICSGTAQFNDNSINSPTNWSWDFGDLASGSANTSTLQNPTHTYATTGQYTVKLTATNSFGSSTITKSSFINYDPTNAYCTNVIMPVTGTGPTATSCSAAIFDPGGPIGQYPNGANSTVTISPANAATITLTFSAFDLENNFDFLKIYDGPNTNSPLIGIYSGTALPNGGVITSTSSALTLSFTSDNVGTRNGFAATWTCSPVTSAPVANFKADLNSICTGVVNFQDFSTNNPTTWTWDFGDGTPTSSVKNPTHTYNTTVPGPYTVTLTACNSFGCNTVAKTSFINISVPCLTYCPSNGHNNNLQWIKNVTVGTINNNTSVEANGYGNYTYLSTNMMLGTTTNPFTVSLGNNSGNFGYVSIWIDTNKDGIFQTTERVFNGQATASTPGGVISVTNSFTIPNTASTGLTRMRVILSQNFNLLDPCILNQIRTEVEDYNVNIQPNTLPTVADFIADLNTVCTGSVKFTDASTNGATSWTWDFGNGTTSTLQNPTAIYSTTTAGSYTVTLTACKNGVCSTVTKTNFVNITVPCLTYCTSSGHTNTNQWIKNVTIGTINNNTVAETNGYGNYNYLNTTAMIGSTNNTFTVTLGNNTGPLSYVSGWIDQNKDGIFQTTERVFNMQATNTGFGNPLIATGTFSISNTAVTGPTRMRIIMSQNFSLTNPCLMSQFNMEVEDYTITIQPNTLPTVADFTANLNNICMGSVQFSDASTNGATSWTWDFGNGTTSTLQNPIAIYSTSTPASFNVTLTACKNGVCTTVTKNNFVNITVPCFTYCASNNHDNSQQWISNVTVGTINNNSGADLSGYGNYIYKNTNMVAGTNNAFSVTLGSTFGGFGYVAIWIDLNKDGIFQTTERVFNGQANASIPGGPVSASGNIAIPTSAALGTTRMRVIMSQNFNLTNPCIVSQLRAETEDYTVTIQANTLPTVADFTANMNSICMGSVQFTDASANGATSWTWDFGNGTTSTLQNPIAIYSTSTAASYNVTLTACKNGVCSTVTKNNFVNITVPCFTYCASNNHTNTNQWISNVNTGTINNNSGAEPGGYGNYTYLSSSAIVGSTNIPVSVRLGNNTGPFAYVAAWADFNQDGIFQTTERIFNVQATSSAPGNPLLANTTFNVPSTAIPGTTRVRLIMSTNNNLTNACTSFLFIGETEDYTLMLQTTTSPPIVNFNATPTTTCNGLVQFTDASSNNPTSWTWDFGDGTTSTAQSPSHTYGTPGVYTVKLTACNSYGCRVITKTSYITYDPASLACSAVNMPLTGAGATNNCKGILYDNGGSTGNYNNNSNSTFTIAPANATSVSLTFTSFDTEFNYDFVSVYDGPNTSSPLIGTYSGVTLPNNGLPLTSTGGALTVRLTSNGFVNSSGFAANWSCANNTGLTNDYNAPGFEVYPNPSSGIVNVKLTTAATEDYQVEVTDLAGKVLLQKKITLTDSKAQELDLNNLAKGIYLIKIRNNHTSGIRKVVID